MPFESIFEPDLCCLTEPENEPFGLFGREAFWGNEGGWQEGGWLLQALGGLPAGKLPATGVASVYKGQWPGNSGIPHSMLQCSALEPNAMSHLWSGFNNAAHLQKAGTAAAIKAAHKPSARVPTQLLGYKISQDSARQIDQSDWAPGYQQCNCLQVLALDHSLQEITVGFNLTSWLGFSFFPSFINGSF